MTLAPIEIDDSRAAALGSDQAQDADGGLPAGIGMPAFYELRDSLFRAWIVKNHPDATEDERNHLYLQGNDTEAPKALRAAWSEAIAEAARAQKKKYEAYVARETEKNAAAVLAEADPFTLVEPEIRRLGFGGDATAPLLAYLAATTRLLPENEPMLAHMCFIGAPSAGKSWAAKTVRKMLPPSAYKWVDAGSPRALIYDRDPLKHKLLVYAEADSIPVGEEAGAASSAIRNLLTDNFMSYDVVIKDKNNEFTTQAIRKDGPTVLFTTTTRRLGDQLMSRMWIVEVPDNHGQLQASLTAAGEAYVAGLPEPNENLIAFQGYLQARAPWDVLVPFAPWLAKRLGEGRNESRLNRDFARIIALTKAVTILRHAHREKAADDRLIATIDDYRTVYGLLKRFYETSVTGVNDDIRAIVGAVRALAIKSQDAIGVSALQKALPDVQKRTLQRLVKSAIHEGWLIDDSTAKTRHDLRIGEALPSGTAMPDPDEYGMSDEEVRELREERAQERAGIMAEALDEDLEDRVPTDIWATAGAAA